jgi:hypothetical protein
MKYLATLAVTHKNDSFFFEVVDSTPPPRASMYKTCLNSAKRHANVFRNLVLGVRIMYGDRRIAIARELCRSS